jgi:hypothetical protein
MAQIVKTQNNFTTGVISPGVSARKDLEKYSAGCAKLVNAVVRPHGGISKRPGTSHIENLSGEGLLFPFTYSVEQTYVLGFIVDGGGVYLRVYSGGGVVVKSNNQPFSLLTPYAPSDLRDIKFAQTADTMFLVHPSYPVHKLVRYGHADWRIEQVVFAPPLSPPTDLTANVKGFEDENSADTTIMYKVAAVNSKEQESIPSKEKEVEIKAKWTEGSTVTLSWSLVPDAVRYEVYKNSRGYYGWIGSADGTTFKDDNIEPDETIGPKEHRNPFGKPGKFQFLMGGDRYEEGSSAVTFEAAYINAQGVEGEYSERTYYVKPGTSPDARQLILNWLNDMEYPSARVVMNYPKFFEAGGSSTDTTRLKKQLIFNRVTKPSVSFKFNSIKVGSKSFKFYDSYNAAKENAIGKHLVEMSGKLELNTSGSELASLNFPATTFKTYFVLDKNLASYADHVPRLKFDVTIDSGFPAHLTKDVTLDKMTLYMHATESHIERYTDGRVDASSTHYWHTYNTDITNGGSYDVIVYPDAGNFQDNPNPPHIKTRAFLTYGEEAQEFYDNIGANPGVVGIYQQRLVLGRTDAEPQTLWFSEIGAFNSFAVATPLRDDSAITVTVDSKQMNEIRHFIPLRDMLMLTSGAEFKITSGKSDGTITPTSVAFPIQGYWGSSDVPPIVTGTSIIFIQNSGKHVRDLQYTLQEDGYSGDDLTILAEHLIDSEIVDWAYQQSPYSVIWIILKSGKLLTFTYMKEQNIWAWAEQESSGGKFKSVCCIREGAEDNVYFIVERNQVNMIEFQERWNYGNDVKNAFFVDSGLMYSGSAINTFSGLKHLKGQKIVVLADGSVYRNITVSDEGKFQLPIKASKVVAGLPYTLTLETLDPEINKDVGPAVVDKKNIVKVVVNLRESLALSVGPDEGNLVTMKIPQIMKWGEPPQLYSGDVVTILPGQHREKATVVFKQEDPVPCTILSVSTYITVG